MAQNFSWVPLCSHLSLTAKYSLKSEKDRSLDFADYEAASLQVLTTMFHQEQLTSHNLIVENNGVIIKMFDKCRLSGILWGCWKRLNTA